jgi:hypothetical protein
MSSGRGSSNIPKKKYCDVSVNVTKQKNRYSIHNKAFHSFLGRNLTVEM